MKKLPAAFIFILLFFCLKTSAGIRLTATTTIGNPAVMLRWNMVNYPGNTAYTLFKSTDGVVWKIAAANPVFRNYSSSTILAYNDNFSDEQKLYYRVKVYDTNENIVDISNTAIIDNPKTSYPAKRPSTQNKNISAGSSEITNGKAWQIIPNPVRDILNLVYRGNELIRGVINIVIQDATGKAVIRFRAASNNKQLRIPVSNLRAGIYFIKINVINEVQMNDKFIKD